MNALFVVEDCPKPVTLSGPDLRKVKHEDYEDYGDYGDKYSYEDTDDLFNTISFQPERRLKKPQVQARSSRGQRTKTWEHYIAAEEVTWDYAPHLKPTDR